MIAGELNSILITMGGIILLILVIVGGIPIRDMFPEGESNLFSRFNQLYDYNNIWKFYEEQVILPVISHQELRWKK